MKWFKIGSPLVILFLVVLTNALPSAAKVNETSRSYPAANTQSSSK